MMSNAEVITILICFHFNTYRNFKHYYLSCICGQWKHMKVFKGIFVTKPEVNFNFEVPKTNGQLVIWQ